MLTNVIDASTRRTLMVIQGPQVQPLNSFTVLANGAVIEFPDAIELEEIEWSEDTHGKAAQPADQ